MSEEMVHGLGCSRNVIHVSEAVILMQERLPDLSSGSSAVEDVGGVRNTERRSGDAGESCCATRNVIEEKDCDHKDENKTWVVNINNVNDGDGEGCEEEKICRICHLHSEQPLKLVSLRSKHDLILLGCGCKGELGVVHSHCAEAWFKLKGNRICEICGQTVNNVSGIGNESFMEEWSGNRTNNNASELNEERQPWRGQPLCNFIMACLVFAFILPWFFHINIW